MKIGFIISMYDEYENVNKNIEKLKDNHPIIVVQSDPKADDLKLNNNLVDHYKILSDLASTRENYIKERASLGTKGSTIPARALSRNFSYGFTQAKNFDVSWWIVILGDVKIENLIGIEKIINQMIDLKKSIGVTQAIGQKFFDSYGKFTRIQRNGSTDFMPHMFIVKQNCVKRGLFNDIKISNAWTTEQCLGDEVKRFCDERSLKFYEMLHIISKYPYPKFIQGLEYNPKQSRWPKYIDSVLSKIVIFKTRF
jgi:hypothetical protein